MRPKQETFKYNVAKRIQTISLSFSEVVYTKCRVDTLKYLNIDIFLVSYDDDNVIIEYGFDQLDDG